ncbi:MAG: protein-glutamate O-methyltransferase CheR [Desulfamplus sp.]|nr:protein-glutamate O-methyltransferase CheR [Desulfamplus sp.]
MISTNEFNQFQDLIYSKTGIYLGESKIDFLFRRIKSRMEELDIIHIKDYWHYLRFDSSSKELGNLILLIVNHETYFFREYPQLEYFVENIIPIIEKEKVQNKTLRVLSAGCSTGDEPYTLAIILREMLDYFSTWQINIDGFDISERALEKAMKAEYADRNLRDTPYIYRDKYFLRTKDTYLLKPEIKNMVRFINNNLYDEYQVSQLPFYDVIFMRNVLIYFDYPSGKKVLESLYTRMNRGGFLFLGQAESVSRFTTIFKMERIGNGFVYRK